MYKTTEIAAESILKLFPTEKVEKNLSLDAKLREDLGLSTDDILKLRYEIEQYGHANELFRKIKDSVMESWVTVSDIDRSIDANIHPSVTLPSPHQIGDKVNVWFGESGTLEGHVSGVKFSEYSIRYDIDLTLNRGMGTTIFGVESACVKK